MIPNLKPETTGLPPNPIHSTHKHYMFENPHVRILPAADTDTAFMCSRAHVTYQSVIG